MNISYPSVITTLLLLLLTNSVGGQTALTLDSAEGVVVHNITGRISVGPKSDDELCSLLNVGQIQNALAFSPSQQAAIQGMLAAQTKIVDEGVRAGKPMSTIAGEVRKLRRSTFEEVLTPTQYERLKQIGLRIEVTVMGLTAALAEGRLHDAVGVTDNQSAHLLEKGAQIERKLQEDIQKLKEQAEADILAELSPEQRQKAKRVLGNYFEYENAVGMKKIVKQQIGVREAKKARETSR